MEGVGREGDNPSNSNLQSPASNQAQLLMTYATESTAEWHASMIQPPSKTLIYKNAVLKNMLKTLNFKLKERGRMKELDMFVFYTCLCLQCRMLI